MSEADLDAVLGIADRVHPDNPESRDALASRLRLFPAGCRILDDGGRAVGYAFAHPARSLEPPPLDCVMAALPDAPDCLHLHDVAVLPEARGRGATGRLLDALGAVARQAGLSHLALVSVNDSVAYWARHGFRPLAAEPGPGLAAILASYAGGGTYMTSDAP